MKLLTAVILSLVLGLSMASPEKENGAGVCADPITDQEVDQCLGGGDE